VSELATVLATVFGSQVRSDGAWLHTLVRSDDGDFPVRVRTAPVAELFVTTRPLDGFELVLRGERMRSDATFDTALTVSTNDHELARLWLDATARTALIDSAYEDTPFEHGIMETIGLGLGLGDGAVRPFVPARRIWSYELGNDELVASKGAGETQPDRIATALSTAVTIVSRCRRWATEYGAIARRIGGEAATEIELGGPPVITSKRSAAEVTLQLLRRLPGDRTGRLRTLITARRAGHHDDRTFSLVARSAVHAMVPPIPTGDRRDIALDDYRMRASTDTAELDELTKTQVAVARPSVVIADHDSIDIWFDGAPIEADRLEAAFALAAQLAIGTTVQHGPYR